MKNLFNFQKLKPPLVVTFLQPNVDSVLALCAEKFWILGELLWNDPAVSCCPGKADLSELQIYLV